MAETKTTIRLGTDGAATVRADFASIGAAATKAMGDITAATETAAAANDRFTQRQLDNFARQAAAAKIAADAERSRGNFDALLGVHAPDTGAARASADAFGLLAPAANEAGTALEHVNTVLGLNRAQTVIAQSALLRFIDTIVSGRSPLTAFALEAHKIPEVLSVDDGGMAGGLAKVTGLLTPFNIGVAAAAAVVIGGAVALYSYTEAVDKLNAVSAGSGRLIGATGAALEANAEAAAAGGRLTVGAARDIETAYVNMGRIGLAVLPGLTRATVDFAAAIGGDIKAATEYLGKAFQDPAKGAEELTERYGYLTQAQIAEIRAAVDANDIMRAQQLLLDGVSTATAHASDNVTFLGRAWQGLKDLLSNGVTYVGRSINEAVDGFEPTKKLVLLQKELADARANYSGGLGQDSHIAALTAEVAAQAKVVDAINAKAKATKDAAVANSQAQLANKAADAFTGNDHLDEYRAKLAAITATIRNTGGGTKELRDAQDAYTHAIATFIPAAEKKRLLDEAEVKTAAAKTPAEKAAAAAAKERIDQSGKLITSAQAEADVTAKAAAAKATAGKEGESHRETLAREAAAMGVAAAASLALARAYLAGGDAAIEAEARKKAATDATKKGIDVEAEVRRQLAVNVAEGAATGAKALDTLRDETAAREKVNALVAAGAISVTQANERLKDEAILRPLLALQAVAQGDALKVLTQVVDDYRSALDRAQASEDRSATNKIVEDAKNTIAGLHDAADFAGDRSGASSVEIARRAALRAASSAGVDDGQAAERANAAAAVETNKLYADRVKYLADTGRAANDNIADARAELATVTLDVNQRALVLDRLKAEQDLRAHGVDLRSAAAKDRLQEVADTDALKAALQRATASMSEFDSIGTKVVDDVFNPANWSSWGNLGKAIIHDLELELLKLAAINPIKNALGLGGGGLPTLGSIGSLLFGSADPVSGGIGSLVASNFAALPDATGSLLTTHNAAGTDYFAGGDTWIAENGPERVTLPRGTKIDNASATRRSLASNDNSRGDLHQHFYLDGAVVDQTLYNKMAAIGVNAQVGGAAIATQGLARRSRYSLG